MGLIGMKIAAKLHPSMQSYAEHAEEIYGWMPDWIDQHQFDMKAEAAPVRAVFTDDQTNMAPIGGQPHMHVLGWMLVAGLVEGRKDDRGVNWYRAVP